jgi:DNA primase catalytic core
MLADPRMAAARAKPAAAMALSAGRASRSVRTVAENNDRESILQALAFAQKLFTDTLLNSNEGKLIGLSYFEERGFSKVIIDKFQLGFSPEKNSFFEEEATKNGFKLEFAERAGLITKRDNDKGYYGRFAGRVMFPVHNIAGRVIAFGGRTLKKEKNIAKYVNSPQTEVYNKSEVLYGLFFAKKEIIAKDNCLLVEGYADVISMFEAGFENVVASSGTSLTVEQIKFCKDKSGEVHWDNSCPDLLVVVDPETLEEVTNVEELPVYVYGAMSRHGSAKRSADQGFEATRPAG